MSRVLIASLSSGTLLVDQNSVAALQANQGVFVYQTGTTTPVTVWQDASTPATLTQPLNTTSTGQIPGYLDSNQIVDFVPVGGSAVATHIVGVGDAPVAVPFATGTDALGRTQVLTASSAKNPALSQYVSSLDAPWTLVGDARTAVGATTVGTALTFSVNRLSASDQGKTIVLPSGGSSGDAFVTTIAQYNSPTSATLASPPTVNVSNVTVEIGTDNGANIRTFVAALIAGSAEGRVLPGSYLTTQRLDFSSMTGASGANGCSLIGAGSGANNSKQGATQFWYAGTGPALMAATATGGIAGLRLKGFSITALRPTGLSPVGSGATGAPSQANPAANTFCAYFDNISHSDFDDIQLLGYTDGSGNTNNTNQGSGWCIVNFSSGGMHVKRCHARLFGGTAVGGQGSEGWRVGSWVNGFGVASDDGGITMSGCSSVNCYTGWRFVCSGTFGGGSVEGSTFNTCVNVGGGSSIGMLIESQFGPCVWNSPHVESQPTGYQINGRGCVINAPLASYLGGSLGDGSSAFNFNSAANGCIVNGGTWGGWTGGTVGAPSGTPGYDVPVIFQAGANGNIVTSSASPGRLVPGTAFVNYNGTTTNRNIDLGNLPNGDTGSGQQAGVVTPDSRISGGFTNVTMTNQVFLGRFVPTRPVACIKIAFTVVTAASANDSIDVGIYTVSGSTLTKLASSGSTAGKVNAGTGVFSINVTANLIPGTVYYAAIAYPAPGGTAAVFQGRSWSATANALLFGATAGTAETGTAAGSPPLATSYTPTWGGLAGTPILVVRES